MPDAKPVALHAATGRLTAAGVLVVQADRGVTALGCGPMRSSRGSSDAHHRQIVISTCADLKVAINSRTK